ncbi:MAG: transglycosylase domain-containing protein [Pseudomonadota bacterium]|uniref:penicillin-binding protein 1A n=1 Tax=Polaromonas sp. TaxID=1869339 RepID=UPI0017C897D7|nr:transglycosylase domain-containing protein [Polaromonas sp.]MBA3594502.1 transglycosylase domain-containing protein [Polaromonas sp.]MDQ3271507.1 transglycosylase domain-containing protein [Pseudomonadota bacterium]
MTSVKTCATRALYHLRHPTLRGVALSLAALPALVLLYVLLLIPFTPSIRDIQKSRTQQPARVMSMDNKELAAFKGANRGRIKLADISPNVVAALISTEDHRFYDHHGLDFTRIGGAVLSTFGGELQGGSTITQQLARNLYPEEVGRSRSLTRKFKEVITALKIEAIYNKDEILETYLNTVPFLYNAFGIEMAAQTYFDKSASKLDVLESATLVGMLKGTSYYNPVINPERAKQRRNLVLAQMVKHNKLDAKKLEALKKRPLKVDFERQTEPLGDAPHLTQFLRRWLIEWADRNDYSIYADGLVVRTTIDSRLQKLANEAVTRQGERLQGVANNEWGPRGWAGRKDLVRALVRETPAYKAAKEQGEADDAILQRLQADAAFMQALRQDKTRLQVGFMALEPSSGHVKAWVGSRDFATDPFDHVQQARRQAGSTFKPFVYGAAFENGARPTNTYMDDAVEISLGGNQVWRPTDSGGPSYAPMTLRQGLMYSKNTITAQVMRSVGPAKVAALAQAAGVRQSKLEEVMSLALGTSPVTLREMVAAYATIANKGSYIEPFIVASVEDRNGKVLESWQVKAPEQAMQASTAETLVDVMRGVIDQGTGIGIRSRHGIQADVAGKTGTTQDNTDGWFILMHPQLVAGAWVGFNDNRITLNDYWGQGAHSALPIVGDFFSASLRSKVVNSQVRFDVQKNSSATAPQPSNPINDWFNGLFPPVGRVVPPSSPDGSPNPGYPPPVQQQPVYPQAAPPGVGVVIPSQPAPGAAPPGYVVVPGRPVTPQERGSGGGIPIIREY